MTPALADGALVSSIAFVVVIAIMLAELRLSRAHERELRRAGAIAVPDPAYPAMRWAYPGTFAAMALEGVLWAPAPGQAALAGVAVFAASKGLKMWAIGALGPRWSYGVFVLPGVPLVRTGPYAWMRHPNYVAVIGELIGMALVTGARVSGPLSLLLFGALLRRRIAIEDRALHRAAAGGIETS